MSGVPEFFAGTVRITPRAKVPICSTRFTTMVEMTRLNGHSFLVNADLIKHVEAIPDTTLTLVTGEKLVVLESCSEVLARTLAWRASLLHNAWPTAEVALIAHEAHHAALTRD